MKPIEPTHCPIYAAGMADFNDRANFKYAWPKSINLERWPETIFALEFRPTPHPAATGLHEIVDDRAINNPLRVVKYDPKEKMVRFSSLADFIHSTFDVHQRTIGRGQEKFTLRSISSMTAKQSRRGMGNVLLTPPNPSYSLDIFDMSNGSLYQWWAEVEGLAPNEAVSIYSGVPVDQGFWFVSNDDGSVDVVMNEANGDRYGYIIEIDFN